MGVTAKINPSDRPAWLHVLPFRKFEATVYLLDVVKPSIAIMTMNVSSVELAIFSNMCIGLKKVKASIVKKSVQ